MFNWLFGKPQQERRIERDAIRAGADDEVWQMNQKLDAFWAEIAAQFKADLERKSK